MIKATHLSIRTLLCFIAVNLLCVTFAVINNESAKAESDWSWSAAPFITVSSTPVSGIETFPICQGYYSNFDIDGGAKSQTVCSSNDDSLSFGTYHFQGGRAAISFPFDSKMHRVNGICSDGGCLYLPGSDVLVTKQNLVNGLVKSLVVYKNFTGRIKRFFNNYDKAVDYNFDTSNPDFIFKDADDYAWPVEGMGSSDNGKWLAVEIRGVGVGLFNIETMQMRLISELSIQYGRGYDALSEFAVSNSGKVVVMMGQNAGITIFDVDSTCGKDVTNGFGTPAKMCKTAPMNVDFIDRFANGFHPRLNSDGGELSFYAKSYTGLAREVTLRAAGYPGQRLDYLALGDSFSSGQGETSDDYYLPGTNEKFDTCHVSSRSYPFLLANLSGIAPQYVRSVACSGATTLDIVGEKTQYIGQNNRLGKGMLNLEDAGKALAKTEAIETFFQGRILQEDFVEKYKPKIITIGIGGNDINLVEKLKSCIWFNTCDWANNAQRKEQTAKEIQNLFYTLVNTFTKLHADSPNSKIYVVGYPKIISTTDKCSLVTGALLSYEERQFMDEGISYLNQIIAAAAARFGIKYLDIQTSYGNNILCGGNQSAINFITSGDDIGPFSNSDLLKIVGSESFHPNPLGHSLTANSIMQSVGNIANFKYCPAGQVVCPDPSINVPEPSSYWIPNGWHNYVIQKNIEFLSDRADSVDNRGKTVILDSRSLEPNSIVNIEVNSTPRQLGQFKADKDGTLTVDIDLPSDLEEGYHTVHIYGASYSGDKIDLYQIINYQKPVPIIVVEEPKPKVISEPKLAEVKTTIAIDDQRLTVQQSKNDETTTQLTDEEPVIVSLATLPVVLGVSDAKGTDKHSDKDSKIAHKNNTTGTQISVIGIFTLAIGMAIILIIRIRKH